MSSLHLVHDAPADPIRIQLPDDAPADPDGLVSFYCDSRPPTTADQPWFEPEQDLEDTELAAYLAQRQG